MTVFTAAGTVLAFAAAAPATYDAAGYGALVATPVGEVGDLGEIPSRVYEAVRWRNIANRGESVAKGGYALGSQTIKVGIDPTDAGQTLLDTLIKSDTPASVKISNPNLGTIWARALVMGGTKSYGDGNAIATRDVTLEYTIVSQTQDGIVYIPPA